MLRKKSSPKLGVSPKIPKEFRQLCDECLGEGEFTIKADTCDCVHGTVACCKCGGKGHFLTPEGEVFLETFIAFSQEFRSTLTPIIKDAIAKLVAEEARKYSRSLAGPHYGRY